MAWAQDAETAATTSGGTEKNAAPQDASAKQTQTSPNGSGTSTIGFSLILVALLVVLAIVLRPTLNNAVAGLILRTGGAI